MEILKSNKCIEKFKSSVWKTLTETSTNSKLLFWIPLAKIVITPLKLEQHVKEDGN